MTITVALAAESDRSLRRIHFGAAPLYSIYRRDEEGHWQHITDIENPWKGPQHGHHHGHQHGNHHGHHHGHRGPGSKFRHIFSELKKYDVNVVGSVQYGPNIRNLRTVFTPVVVNEGSPDDALAAIERHLDLVNEQIRAGESRRHLMLRALKVG